MNNEELKSLLEKAMLSGIALGKKLESNIDKKDQLPIAIRSLVKWEVQELLKEKQNNE